MGSILDALMRQWKRLGLNRNLIISMIRNALPPAISLWTVYSTSLGQEFDIVGYLPMILTVLELPSPPRVQFLRSMLVTCVLNMVIAGLCLLAGFCGTQARYHTTPSGGDLSAYNGSAAAVTGVWMVFTVWLIQTWRGYHPQYAPSAAICSIFAEVTIGIGAQLTTMTEYTQLVTQMLEMFFLAHGFVTAANLLFFPITSRAASLNNIKSYLCIAGDVLMAEAACVRSLESTQPRARHSHENSDPEHGESPSPGDSPDQILLTKLIASMSHLHGTLRSSISFAKKDTGWSTISGDDFVFIEESFRKLVVTLRGMASLMPIFENLCNGMGWNTSVSFDGAGTDSYGSQNRDGEKHDENNRLEWLAVFSDMQGPVDEITHIMLEGLQHVSICLSLQERAISPPEAANRNRKSDPDPEPTSGFSPGSASFIPHLRRKLDGFHETRGAAFPKWKNRNDGHKMEENDNLWPQLHMGGNHDTRMEQMFVVLFLQHLFHHVAEIVFELADFADGKNPYTRKKYLVHPTSHRLWKLFRQLDKEDGSQEDRENDHTQASPTIGADLARVVSRRSVKRTRRSWKGLLHPLFSSISRVSKVIGSRESLFGFRVAMAVMSVIIVGLLEPSQTWFYDQRGLWALVFIPYSMAPNSGETISMLLFRLAGAGAALVVAIVNWYVVDGHPAGVIVIFFLYNVVANYLVVEYPRYGTIWRPHLMTLGVIIGYSLLAKKSSIPQPPATTTQRYPIYLIAPYRFACVLVGVFAAFVWTIFPRVISSRSIARKKLGHALSLVGSYYNCMHSTVGLWASGAPRNLAQQQRLNKARDKLFSRQLITLDAIREHIRFSRFEPSMGHDFPGDLYRDITDQLDSMISYMNLIIYATTFLSPSAQEEPFEVNSTWRQRLLQAYTSPAFTSHSNVALLSVLSMSVSENQPLPPGLTVSKPYHLARLVREIGPETSEWEMVQAEGFSEFAVVEIGFGLLYGSLARLLERVEELVGVWDFGGAEKMA